MNFDEQVSKAVYKIITAGGSGTGFVLKGHDIWVTNHHVISGNRQVTIEDQDKNRYQANVIFINPNEDIAFLRPEAPIPHEYGVLFDELAEVKASDKV